MGRKETFVCALKCGNWEAVASMLANASYELGQRMPDADPAAWGDRLFYCCEPGLASPCSTSIMFSQSWSTSR